VEIDFKIENIVASANLKEELDLYKIARDVSNVEYEPEQFPGAILKLKDPKTSLLLFKNGKLICTGAKSRSDVEAAIAKTYKMINDCIKQQKGVKPPAEPHLGFEIVNIVSSANLKLELDLYNIARTVNDVEYEPEQFPGAILKLKEPKTSLLLFKNGKLICTGARSKEDVKSAINKAFDLIKDCVKGPVKDEPVTRVPIKPRTSPRAVKKAKPVITSKPVAVRRPAKVKKVVRKKPVKKAKVKPKKVKRRVKPKAKPRKVVKKKVVKKKVVKKRPKKAARKPAKKVVKKKAVKKRTTKKKAVKKVKPKAKRTVRKTKPKKRWFRF